MSDKELPTSEYLRRALRYDPETGFLFWREHTPDMFSDGKKTKPSSRCKRWNVINAGNQAFNSISHGYLAGTIKRRTYRAHRVIWAMHHGWPDNDIDHINGIRTDNRLENLREATRAENCRNRAIKSTSKSGIMGVYWREKEGVWTASIKTKEKTKWLGSFAKKQDAIAARKAAEKENGFHPNHGRKPVDNTAWRDGK